MKKGSFLALTKLKEYFESLPGIGHKSAERYAYQILKMSDEKATGFANAILEAKSSIRYCERCCNFTDKMICSVCEDSSRDFSVLCVVEHPRDVDAIERTDEYNGKYHVLHGAISPINGVGPDELHIRNLISRISKEKIKEIILATNPTVEGEATAMYISKLVKPLGVKTTRLAYGIPVGASLEFADEVTLSRALSGRNEI